MDDIEHLMEFRQEYYESWLRYIKNKDDYCEHNNHKDDYCQRCLNEL